MAEDIRERLLGAWRTAHHAAMSEDEEEIRIADAHVEQLESEFLAGATATVRRQAALEQLADPANWIGDPTSDDAEFVNEMTPFELACDVLAEIPEDA